MRNSAKRFRSFICTLVAFVMALSVVLTVFGAALSASALNPSFAVLVEKRSSFGADLAAELKEEFVSYGNACNIDAVFFDGIFEKVVTPEKIDEDMQTVLRDFYNGSVQDTVDTAEMQAAVLEQLKSYATEKGFTLDETTVQNLTTISQELCEMYNAYVSVFSMSAFQTASQLLNRYRPLGLYAAAAGAVVFVIAAVLLRLFFHKKKNYLRFFIYAFSGATLMQLFGPLVALIIGVGNRINISSSALYDLASGMINGVLLVLALSALLPAAITVLLAVVYHREIQKDA